MDKEESMNWIKISDRLPPIGEHVLTCRKIPKHDWVDENQPEYLMAIMSLHRKVKKTGKESWITWHSLDHIMFTEEQDSPEYWMYFPNPPAD